MINIHKFFFVFVVFLLLIFSIILPLSDAITPTSFNLLLPRQHSDTLLPELEIIDSRNIHRIAVVAELEVDYNIDYPWNCDVDFNDNATMLAVAGGFCNELSLWDLLTGNKIITPLGERLGRRSVARSPFFNVQNEVIVVQYSPHKRWYNATKNSVHEYRYDEDEYYTIEGIRFNRTDTLLFIGGRLGENALLLADYETGEHIEAISVPWGNYRHGIGDVEFNPSGLHYAMETFEKIDVRETRASNAQVALLDKGQANLTFSNIEGYFPTGLAFSFDGSLLASNQGIWNVNTWELLVSFPPSFVDHQLVRGISPDGSLLYTTRGLWDVSKGELVKEVEWAAVAPNWRLAVQWGEIDWEKEADEPIKLILFGVPKITESEENTSQHN